MYDNLLKLIFFIWFGLFFEKLLGDFYLFECFLWLLLSIIMDFLYRITLSFLEFVLLLFFLRDIFLLFFYLFALCWLFFLDVFNWWFDDNDRLFISFCLN